MATTKTLPQPPPHRPTPFPRFRLGTCAGKQAKAPRMTTNKKSAANYYAGADIKNKKRKRAKPTQ